MLTGPRMSGGCLRYVGCRWQDRCNCSRPWGWGCVLRRLLVVLIAGLVGGSVWVAPARAISAGARAPGVGFVARVNVGGVRSCTGALVDSQWVLTARSCFHVDGQPVRTGAPGLATTVTIGSDTVGGPAAPVLPVKWIVPHPERDVLLARLSLRLPDLPAVPVSGTAPAAGEALAVHGYGRTSTEWVPDQPQKAAVTVESVAGATFRVTAGGVAACKGDAGGPVVRGDSPALVGLVVASGQSGCLAEPDGSAGADAVRVDDIANWIARNTIGLTSSFRAFYRSNTVGIGGYDLNSSLDEVVPFDYDHSGKLDHLVLYRPGSRIVFVVKHNADDTYTPVFKSTTGVGGWDLASSADRVIAFDLTHSGKLDHLLLYRPGASKYKVLRHGAGNSFSTVIDGTWTALADPRDRLLAFDYTHTGKPDHLIGYRPGTGRIQIITHDSGNVFQFKYSSATGGIGGWDLRNAADRIIAFDLEHSGKSDHLMVYRPGTGRYMILRHGADDSFIAAINSTWTGVQDSRDQVVALDYDRTGKLDSLVGYRPGTGRIQIITHESGNVFQFRYSSATGGIGEYNLASTADRIVAFDNDHSGGANYLLAYRPGARIAWVIGRVAETVADAPVTVQAPADASGSLVEGFSYPDAQRILAELNVRLISGDGHILLADCATPPVDNVGVIKVFTTELLGPDGAGLVCFEVLGPTGRLDLEVPGVFEIRGDGQRADTGHQLTAVVTTESGPPTTVVCDPSGSTQVGIGADPNAAPTTLLQLRVPS
jgi:hypothetical protein